MPTPKFDLALQGIHFAADAHLLHKNVLALDNRPFSTLEEMQEEIIANWNRAVAASDTVFCLGDFFLGNRLRSVALLNRLNGNLHYILGNHDSKGDIQRLGRFLSVEHYARIAVLDEFSPNARQDIVLSHYPMQVWDMSDHGSWMLHGHVHGSLNKTLHHRRNRIFDVGLNCNNYTPVSFSYLRALFLDRQDVTRH